MRKGILVLMFLLFPLGLLADPRIEVTGDFCHVPFDAENQDNESFISNCGGVVTVTNGVAEGYATVEKSNVPLRVLPVRPSEGESKAEIRLSSADAGFTCVLVDSNGTQYQAARWNAWTLAVQANHPAMGYATYEVFCFDATVVAGQ